MSASSIRQDIQWHIWMYNERQILIYSKGATSFDDGCAIVKSILNDSEYEKVTNVSIECTDDRFDVLTQFTINLKKERRRLGYV